MIICVENQSIIWQNLQKTWFTPRAAQISPWKSHWLKAPLDPGPSSELELLDLTPLKSAACRNLTAKLGLLQPKSWESFHGFPKIKKKYKIPMFSSVWALLLKLYTHHVYMRNQCHKTLHFTVVKGLFNNSNSSQRNNIVWPQHFQVK